MCHYTVRLFHRQEGLFCFVHVYPFTFYNLNTVELCFKLVNQHQLQHSKNKYRNNGAKLRLKYAKASCHQNYTTQAKPATKNSNMEQGFIEQVNCLKALGRCGGSTGNPCTQETKAEGSTPVQGQPGLPYSPIPHLKSPRPVWALQ